MRNVGAVLGIVLIVLLVLLLFGGVGMMGFGGFGMMGRYGGYGMMGPYGMHGFFGPFGVAANPVAGILSFVFWALIIGGIVLLVVWAVRSAGRAGTFAAPAARASEALEILKTRYAKGEITKEQYDQMRQDLA